MTLKLGNFTYHISSVPCRYNLTVNITRNREKRKIELGYFAELTQSLRQQIRERDNYTCQVCGQYGKDVDHIIPWRISHDNSAENLRVLCHKCNLKTRLKRRDARLPLEQWIKYLESELAEYKENQLALDLPKSCRR